MLQIFLIPKQTFVLQNIIKNFQKLLRKCLELCYALHIIFLTSKQIPHWLLSGFACISLPIKEASRYVIFALLSHPF